MSHSPCGNSAWSARAESGNSVENDFGFSMSAPPPPFILGNMIVVEYRIPQPGGTGNFGALRTLKAVQRASPLGRIGGRSIAASVRYVESLFWELDERLTARLCGASHHRDGWRKPGATPEPAGLCADHPRCKSPQSRLDGTESISIQQPAPDPRPTQSRSFRGVMSSTMRIFGSACPAVGDDSRVVERYRPSATGASSGLTLNALRIARDRHNRSRS